MEQYGPQVVTMLLLQIIMWVKMDVITSTQKIPVDVTMTQLNMDIIAMSVL